MDCTQHVPGVSSCASEPGATTHGQLVSAPPLHRPSVAQPRMRWHVDTSAPASKRSGVTSRRATLHNGRVPGACTMCSYERKGERQPVMLERTTDSPLIQVRRAALPACSEREGRHFVSCLHGRVACGGRRCDEEWRRCQYARFQGRVGAFTVVLGDGRASGGAEPVSSSQPRGMRRGRCWLAVYLQLQVSDEQVGNSDFAAHRFLSPPS